MSATRQQWARRGFLALLFAANAWVWLAVWSGPGRLVVTFLDVGQGDAAVVQSPSGKVMLIDTGPVTESDDAGRRVVLPFLRSQGIGAVQAILLTHPHDDHVGGALTVIERVPVKTLLVPTLDSSEARYLRTLKACRTKNVSIQLLRRGSRLDFGDGLTAEVVNPTESLARSPNNGSIAVRLRYGAAAILLTGDAEEEAETSMASACDLKADVLKLGHHGSRTSTVPRFLEAVDPRAAVVSVGARNLFGHPSPDVLARVEDAGIRIFRTDREGAIVVESEGRQISIRRTQRNR